MDRSSILLEGVQHISHFVAAQEGLDSLTTMDGYRKLKLELLLFFAK